MKQYYKFILFLVFILITENSYGQNITAVGGGLLVAPTKVVFEGNKSTQELVLRNRGADVATYRISVVNREKNPETGRMEDIELSGYENGYADQMIRYSPRTVVLRPGEVQTIRVALKKPDDLPNGEYRTRMVFQAVPPPLDIEKQVEENTEEVKLELRAVYGISIPIKVVH